MLDADFLYEMGKANEILVSFFNLERVLSLVDFVIDR